MDQTFVNMLSRQNIKTVFFVENLNILMENAISSRNVQKFNVHLEKINTSNSFQIRVTEVNNYTQMYVSTIDGNTFEQIKTEQAINVSFNGFIDHLMSILEGCKNEELYIAVTDRNGYKMMQFFEKRPIKNLIHLCLPLCHAKTEEILLYINKELEQVRNKLIASKAHIEAQTLEASTKDRIIEQQKTEIKSLNKKLLDQDQQLIEHDNNEIKRLQRTIKQMQETNEGNEKKWREEIRLCQEKIDVLSREAAISNEKFMQVAKREEVLIQENNRLNSVISSLRNDNQQMQRDLDQCTNKKKQLDKRLSDLTNQNELSQENFKKHQKRIQELLAEIEAEKNITHTHRNALQMATEEISSANRIIIKQSKEIEKLKNKIEIRTDVALKQEKLMEQKEKENADLNNLLIEIKKEYNSAQNSQSSYLETMENIQDSVVTLNEKYKNKIKELQVAVDHAMIFKRK